jgi:multiple sugar transport system permease protein
VEAATHPVPGAIEPRRPPKAVRRKRLLITIADHSILIGFAIAFLAPFVFIVLTSLMTNDQALSSDLWPHPFRFSNFADVFDRAPMLTYALNSFLYAGLATLGVLISSVPVGDAFSIFLLRQFFLTIPEEYSDAARVDGAGEFRVMLNVVVRLARPALVAVALFSFLFCWNDFFGPLLYTGDNPAHWTLSVGLAQFRNVHQVQWNLTMAATILFMLPVILLFFAAQKAFIEGVTLTGVKG